MKGAGARICVREGSSLFDLLLGFELSSAVVIKKPAGSLVGLWDSMERGSGRRRDERCEGGGWYCDNGTWRDSFG